MSAHGAGTWGFPGGKVDPGEGPFQTALRETFEETGIVVPEGKVQPSGFTYDEFTDAPPYVTLYYAAHLGDVERPEPQHREPAKAFGWKWIHRDKVLKLNLFLCLKNYLLTYGRLP